MEESNGIEGRHEQATKGEDRLANWRSNYNRRHGRKAKVGGFAVKVTGLALAAVVAVVVTTNRSGELEASPVDPNSSLTEVSPPAPTLDEVAEVTAETEESTVAAIGSTGGSNSVGVVEESVRLWQLDGHAWVQFDYESDENVWLHWRDAQGRSSLNPIECTFTTREGFRRCYTGRSYPRIQISLDRGYTPGMWSVLACEDERGTNCVEVGKWEIPEEM